MSFRPFAPSILREDVNECFELDSDSPYMLLVADLKKGKHCTMTADEKALFGISIMSKRFGRRYNGAVLKPDDGFIFNLYANLRAFVGDRLSLTTFMITAVPRFLRPKESGSLETDKIVNLNKQVIRTFELIKDLSRLTVASNVKLYVVTYPSLFETIDTYRQESVLLLEKFILENLPEVFYLNVDELVDARLQNHNRVRADLRYRTDRHLSKYGHCVMSEIFMDIFSTDGLHIIEAVGKRKRRF